PDLIRRALVLLADHELNASTFTARVVASTQADLFAAVAAGYCALTGPLHGGAPEPVLEMLDAIGSRERIQPWVDAALARGERMMGFGHRVYRVRDPRADVLKAAIEALASDGADLPFAGEVEAYIRTALRRKNPDRPIETNVEFFTA
ncbi:citrate synthase/methylcitrate synthase, partial [Herbaspirillum sp. HC18]